MIEKTIKIVTATHLRWMMKAHDMLSEQQMREHQNCFIETTLNLLINQMHEIWNAENYVVFLLTLDIIKVYDRMICKHLIHMLRAKKISVRIINWIYFFMINWIIILVLANYEIKKILISMRILQKLFLSFIFYFFYMIELLETCNNINDRFNVSNFINDINLFTYNLFTKWNCHILMKTHKKCLN